MLNPLSHSEIVELSQTLHKARLEAQEIEPLSKTCREFTLEQAYEIQKQGILQRQTSGEKIIGYKMGLTSKAKMEQMGLHQPIFGVLTDKMQVADRGEFSLENKIHPKAEPEIYFITKKNLRGEVSREEALAACDQIGVALEILDSRFKGFKYFTLPDVVADNSSSAYFVLGQGVQEPFTQDLKNALITFSINEEARFTAPGSAILGDPLLSLCELVRLLNQQDMELPAGSIVLAGAATQAVELSSGQKVTAHLQEIGTVEFQVP